MSHNSKVPQVNQVQIEEENNVNVYNKSGGRQNNADPFLFKKCTIT